MGVTLEELRKRYPSAYLHEFKTMKEAKEIGWIPLAYQEGEGIKDAFPNYCVCGTENKINEKLTRATCCNPRCPMKEGIALSEMFTRFKIKGLGDEICKEIYNLALPSLETKSHVEILRLTPKDFPSYFNESARGATFFNALKTIKSGRYTYLQIIANLGIPSFGNDIQRIFEGISSAFHLKHILEAYHNDPSELCFAMGIQDVEFIYHFTVYLVDLYLAQVLMGKNLRLAGKTALDICITGRLCCRGVSMTKKEFIDLCNRSSITSDGTQLYEVKMTQAIESVDYIVADAKSNSRKYRAGERRGILITSDEFLELIEKEVETWEQQKV